jgi:predicted nuclease of predicted toxin-antitoxin system
MRFLVDNALPASIASGLRNAGHDAIHVHALGMAAARDDEIFAYAAQERRVLVSADTDFGTILALSGMTTPSVILLRRTHKKPPELLNVILDNLKQLAEDLENGAVVVIEDRRLRIRKLPI